MGNDHITSQVGEPLLRPAAWVLQAPGTFGEFQAVADGRVMQFALRYEF